MRKSRKTIALEAEYVELLKKIAKSRGMSISSYLRRLVEEVALMEEMGFFAPRALSERRIEVILSRLGFTISHPDLCSEGISDEVVIERGVLIGKTLRELELDPLEVIELIGLMNQLIILQGDNIVILPQFDPLKKKQALLLRGIARGAGLNITESGDIVIIAPMKKTTFF